MFTKLLFFVDQQPLLVGCLVTVVLAIIVLEKSKAGTGISPSQLVTMINRDHVWIVDVRNEKDFRAGHITAAEHLPATSIEKQNHYFEKHRHKKLVLVCNSGMSTRSIAENLLIQGYDVVRLAGGMAGWQDANLPTVNK